MELFRRFPPLHHNHVNLQRGYYWYGSIFGEKHKPDLYMADFDLYHVCVYRNSWDSANSWGLLLPAVSRWPRLPCCAAFRRYSLCVLNRFFTYFVPDTVLTFYFIFPTCRTRPAARLRHSRVIYNVPFLQITCQVRLNQTENSETLLGKCRPVMFTLLFYVPIT